MERRLYEIDQRAVLFLPAPISSSHRFGNGNERLTRVLSLGNPVAEGADSERDNPGRQSKSSEVGRRVEVPLADAQVGPDRRIQEQDGPEEGTYHHGRCPAQRAE